MQPVIAPALTQNNSAQSTVNTANQPENGHSILGNANIASTVNNIKIAKNTDSTQNTTGSLIAQQRNKQNVEATINSRSDSATINKNSGMERLLAAEQRMEKAQKTKKTSHKIRHYDSYQRQIVFPQLENTIHIRLISTKHTLFG